MKKKCYGRVIENGCFSEMLNISEKSLVMYADLFGFDKNRVIEGFNMTYSEYKNMIIHLLVESDMKKVKKNFNTDLLTALDVSNVHSFLDNYYSYKNSINFSIDLNEYISNKDNIKYDKNCDFDLIGDFFVDLTYKGRNLAFCIKVIKADYKVQINDTWQSVYNINILNLGETNGKFDRIGHIMELSFVPSIYPRILYDIESSCSNCPYMIQREYKVSESDFYNDIPTPNVSLKTCLVGGENRRKLCNIYEVEFVLKDLNETISITTDDVLNILSHVCNSFTYTQSEDKKGMSLSYDNVPIKVFHDNSMISLSDFSVYSNQNNYTTPLINHYRTSRMRFYKNENLSYKDENGDVITIKP